MSLRRALIPEPESNSDFSEYLGRAGRLGPVAVSCAELVAGALALARPGDGSFPALALAGLAVLTALFSSYGPKRLDNRVVCGCSAAAAAFMLMAAGPDGMFGLAAVVLSAVASVPFRPAHVAWMGVAASTGMLVGFGPRDSSHALILLVVVALCLLIAALNYLTRRSEFEAARESVRVAEALGGAQLRAQLAENAVSIGKMAAALTHELNSPMGALRSSISTLLGIMRRQTESGAAGDRFSDIGEQLRRSIDDSAARIDEVMASLQRLINLEESEPKTANLNELLSDVTLQHYEELHAGHIELDLNLDKQIPPITCRPQLLRSVFSSLLRNAVQAVDGDGHIWISTNLKGDELVVTIRDNGHGMTPEQADDIFAPSLRVEGSRVSSSNWSLFNSRQIIYEHGGEIRIDTAPGKGTAFHVSLPVS